MTDAFEEYAKIATQPGSALPEAKDGGHPGPGDGHSRRSLLTAIGRLSLAGAVVQAVSSSALASPAVAKAASGEAGEKAFEATADKVIDALESAYGVNPGKRRNHTKGFGALGSIVGSSVAAAYSRSPLFSGQEIQVVARFSVAGGDPDASDAERSARGIGLEFRLPGGDLHHITMLHTPMFFATMPKTFLDKFMALKPEAATGKPDPAKIGAFLKSHPDNAAQFHFVQVNNPPPSYANCAFYGIHTFKFVNEDNKVTKVRFRFVPRDGEKQLSDADLKSAPNNFLERAFNDRVGQGPVRWDMMVTIGQPGDSEDDPTILWSADRREFKAGTLTLASAMPDPNGGKLQNQLRSAHDGRWQRTDQRSHPAVPLALCRLAHTAFAESLDRS